MNHLDTVFYGDCLQILKTMSSGIIDLIITSPPYADQRKHIYGGVHPDKYVEWFGPYSSEFLRVLNPRGSFILNIKEKVTNGERHTYVLELIIQLRKQGWLWTEEYIWCKKNSYPGKWPNRFRDGWERLLHFTKNKSFDMFQEEVMIPIGEWSKSRHKNLSDTDKIRRDSKLENGFGINISNWVKRDMVYPNNVLYLPTENYNRGHAAAFPIALPVWFIKLFTKKDGVVLDPFNGSGTSCLAAKQLGRHYIGIDNNRDYVNLANNRLQKDTNNDK